LKREVITLYSADLSLRSLIDRFFSMGKGIRILAEKKQELKDRGFEEIGGFYLHSDGNTTNLELMKNKVMITSFLFNEVDFITLTVEPKDLNVKITHDKSYSLGGALVGAAIDGLLGSLREPKLKRSYDFRLTVSLHLVNGEILSQTPIWDSFGYDLTRDKFEKRVAEILGGMKKQIGLLEKHFPGKVRAV
jgi:hypothetical protein